MLGFGSPAERSILCGLDGVSGCGCRMAVRGMGRTWRAAWWRWQLLVRRVGLLSRVGSFNDERSLAAAHSAECKQSVSGVECLSCFGLGCCGRARASAKPLSQAPKPEKLARAAWGLCLLALVRGWSARPNPPFSMRLRPQHAEHERTCRHFLPSSPLSPREPNTARISTFPLRSLRGPLDSDHLQLAIPIASIF